MLYESQTGNEINMSIGLLGPKESVTIELELCFIPNVSHYCYCLTIPTKYIPNNEYSQPIEKEESKTCLASEYTLEFDCKISSETPISLITSKNHKMDITLSSTKKEVQAFFKSNGCQNNPIEILFIN